MHEISPIQKKKKDVEDMIKETRKVLIFVKMIENDMFPLEVSDLSLSVLVSVRMMNHGYGTRDWENKIS